MKIDKKIIKAAPQVHLIYTIVPLIFLSFFLLCNWTFSDAAIQHPSSKEYWRAFRHQNPLFIQDVILSSPLKEGKRLLLLSEPPPLLYGKIKEILSMAFGDAYEGHDIFTQNVGFDGWVKDIVVRLTYSTNSELRFKHDIALLHKKIFGTDYKAGYRIFDVKPWSFAVTLKRKYGAPPNLRVSADSINEWLFEKSIKFFERTAAYSGFHSISDKPIIFKVAFTSGRTGVFYSQKPGLVVLIIDRNHKLNEIKAYLRQFCLDTDAVIGAVGMEDDKLSRFAIIGRERDTAISAMPPLRVETILTLAATDEENLAQSYERTLALSDKTMDKELVQFVGAEKNVNFKSIFFSLILGKSWYGATSVDWAPILLSHDLTHTEYGNLLNVTDQILKGWSESSIVRYGNFPYPAPFEYPYRQGAMKSLSKYLKDSPLTYNWNTAGFGSWVSFGEYNIFALHRTGALPVSYIIDSTDFATTVDSEEAFIKAEDKYWHFFSELRDPNLNRAAQYAALHVIFRKYAVIADREEHKPSLHAYNQRWQSLEIETLTALNKSLENSDWSESELEASLDACQCMSVFKSDDLRNWLSNKKSILTKIKKYLNSKYTMHDLAKLLTEPGAYLKRLYDDNAKVSKLIATSNEINILVDEFNRDVNYCNNRNQKNSYAFDLECSSLQIESRRRTIKSKQVTWIQLRKDIDKFEQEIMSLNKDVKTFRVAVEVFGNCNKAWRGVVNKQKKFSFGFIKTPSIVVSRYDSDVYGGHNLDGRSIKVIPDNSVSRGNFRYDPDMDVLKIHPNDKANAGAVARSFERLRKKYLTGSSSYKQRVNSRIRLALAKPTGAVESIDSALVFNVPATRIGRGFGSSSLDIDRTIIGGRTLAVSVSDAQRFKQMTETWGAHVLVQKTQSGHRVFYSHKGAISAIETDAHHNFQRAVEKAVDRTVQNLSGKEGNVSIISDGTMSWGDMELLHLTANARKTAITGLGDGNHNFVDVMRIAAGDKGPPSGGKGPPSGGKGPPSGGKGPPSGGKGFFFYKKAKGPTGTDGRGRGFFKIFAGLNRNTKQLLARTDANWFDAQVVSNKLISKKNNGVVILKLKVPFKKPSKANKIEQMIMRITSFFKRKPKQSDVDNLSDVVFKSFAKDKPEDTVKKRIFHIREEYRKRVRKDAYLRFRLQQANDDIYIGDIIIEVEAYEQV